MFLDTSSNFKVENFTGLKDFEIRQTHTVITGVGMFKSTHVFKFRCRSSSPTQDTFMIANTSDDVMIP